MRAALYARVSTEEQVEGYSLDAQRRAFGGLVSDRGWSTYREYVEEGRSAHTDDIRKRPVFKEAIDNALAGKYDVFVVHKIDRFARKLRVTLEYFEKLGKAGVGFVSIQKVFQGPLQVDRPVIEGETPPTPFLLREIEIINVISACAEKGNDPEINSSVETFIVECTDETWKALPAKNS
ncbi:MAG: recombinase family protein [Acidobacteria bacterium]|nr:recombinase family protein [Acidobacteriota bacterium]